MTNRATRYEVFVVRHDGTEEMVSCFSQRVEAVKRVDRIVRNRTGWPDLVKCFVRDTMPAMVDGRFVNVLHSHYRA